MKEAYNSHTYERKEKSIITIAIIPKVFVVLFLLKTFNNIDSMLGLLAPKDTVG